MTGSKLYATATIRWTVAALIPNAAPMSLKLNPCARSFCARTRFEGSVRGPPEVIYLSLPA